jgi:CRP-like cAMP-binding protein
MQDQQHPDHTGEINALLGFIRNSRDVVFLPLGAMLFMECEPCRGAYFIEDGELELTVMSGEQPVIIANARQAQIIAVSSVFTDSDFQYSARAVCDTKVVLLEKESLKIYLRQNAVACLDAIQLLGTDLLDLSAKIKPVRHQPRRNS